MNRMKKWDTLHCFVMSAAGIAYWLMQYRSAVLAVALASFLFLLLSEWSILKELHPFGGYANWVTFLRWMILILIFAFSGQLSNVQIALLFLGLILLDGLDGFLARHFHHETVLGANFDMETDALYVCMASILLLEKGLVGRWILIIGFLRYLYIVLVYFLGMHQLTEKRTRIGPIIGVLLFIGLLIPFILPRIIYFPFLIVVSVMVSMSFSWSFYLLAKEKERQEN